MKAITMFHPHLNPPPSRGRKIGGCATLHPQGGGEKARNDILADEY